MILFFSLCWLLSLRIWLVLQSLQHTQNLNLQHPTLKLPSPMSLAHSLFYLTKYRWWHQDPPFIHHTTFHSPPLLLVFILPSLLPLRVCINYFVCLFFFCHIFACVFNSLAPSMLYHTLMERPQPWLNWTLHLLCTYAQLVGFGWKQAYSGK